MILSHFPVLIVEDDRYMFERMQHNLHLHATNRDLLIQVHHTVAAIGARQKVQAFKPLVVSVDMNFFMRTGDTRTREDAGLLVLSWLNRSHPHTKTLVYSGEQVATTKMKLLSAHQLYPNETSLPLIFQKSHAISDDQWSQAVLDLLMSR